MDKLDQLHKTLDGYSQLLIIPHNDPDPDAIASAISLKYLLSEKFGIESQIRYRGLIGRAENKALVSYLKHPLKRLRDKDFDQNLPVALIDTQPGAGNHPLPENIQARIVIDHHTWRDSSSRAHFADIRPDIGASSTILTKYIQAANINLPPNIATALFYGIKTDTVGLGRGASLDDSAVYFFLQPQVDVAALVQIEHAQVPVAYFKNLTSAIQAARLYDNFVVSYLGPMKYPDMGAEIGDLLLRLKGVKWVLCTGVYGGDLILSVRSRSQRVGAGNLVQHIVGDLGTAGGHGTMAGGQIQLNHRDPKQLAEQLTNFALQYIQGDNLLVGKPLI